MPWVTINMLAGRDEAIKTELHNKVARAVYETLDIPPDYVKVQLVEMKDEDHSIGGVTIDKLPPKS